MHALRLDLSRQRQLQKLQQAGPRGLPVVLLWDAVLFEEWGLGEFFEDATRILTSRIRISASGDRIATTLINPTSREN